MDKYTILKIRLRSELANFYGISLIIIDRELKILEKVDAIATRIPTFYNNFPMMTWDQIQKEIIQMFFDGKNISNLSKNIIQGIEKLFLTEEIDYLIKLIDNSPDKFQSILLENINRSLVNGDCKIEIVKYEVSSLVNSGTSIDSINTQNILLEEETIEFDIPAGVTVIPLKPALAPVSGKPIYEIVPGDKIYVYIENTFPKARDYQQYFNALADDKVLPIKAEIIEVRIDLNNNYILLVKLEETTYGQIVEEEKVKIKLVNEVQSSLNTVTLNEQASNTKAGKQKSTKASSSIIYILLGIVGLLVLSIILLFLL